MDVIRADSWDEVLGAIEHVKKQAAALADGSLFHLLYRGQANADWTLRTTLDRYLRCELGLFDYLREAENACRPIASYTGRHIDETAFNAFSEAIAEATSKDRLPRPNLGLTSYLVYLRQFGFPSPLLDWTESPWIAAFFAVRYPSAADCAVYAFSESRGRSTHEQLQPNPELMVFGPLIPTDKRHFAQQAQYTMVVTRPGLTFGEHEAAFDVSTPDHSLHGWKIVFPSKLQLEVRDHLQQFNLNAFTLFGTEEALLESIAHQWLGRLRHK